MIELRADKRHLVGGLVAACLITAWIVYAGTTDPGAVYYKPDYSAHTGNKYDEVGCGSCHVAFKPRSDDKCLECHYKLAQMLRLPPERQVIPDVTASARLHSAIGMDRKCGECHVEHARSDLAEALKQKLETKTTPPTFFAMVHDLLPPDMQGPDHCAKCHTPEEIQAAK